MIHITTIKRIDISFSEPDQWMFRRNNDEPVPFLGRHPLFFSPIMEIKLPELKAILIKALEANNLSHKHEEDFPYYEFIEFGLSVPNYWITIHALDWLREMGKISEEKARIFIPLTYHIAYSKLKDQKTRHKAKKVWAALKRMV